MKFPWLAEATAEIDQMLEENTVEEERQLKEYQKFEYILNLDVK